MNYFYLSIFALSLKAGANIKPFFLSNKTF